MVKKRLSSIILTILLALSALSAQADTLFLTQPAIGRAVSKNADTNTQELQDILKDGDFKKELRKGIIGFLKRASVHNPEVSIKRAEFDSEFDPEKILIPLLFIDNVISFSDEFSRGGSTMYKGNIYIGMSFLIFQASSESLIYSLPMIISVPYLGGTPESSLLPFTEQIRTLVISFFTDPNALNPKAEKSLSSCLADPTHLFNTETCAIGDITLSAGTLERIANPDKFSALARILANQALSAETLVIPAKSRFPGIRKGLHAAVSMFGVSFQQGSEKGFSKKDNVYQTRMKMPKPEKTYNLTIKTGLKDGEDCGAFVQKKFAAACYFNSNGNEIKCINSVETAVSKDHTGVSDIYFYNALINSLSSLESCKK